MLLKIKTEKLGSVSVARTLRETIRRVGRTPGLSGKQSDASDGRSDSPGSNPTRRTDARTLRETNLT
jgi:hypothetical protein